MRNHETAPFRSECGCTVQIAPTGVITGYRADCKTPIYGERIVVKPCHEHDDHEHGVFRKQDTDV